MVLEGLRCRGARADEAMVIGRIIDGAFKHEKRTGHLLVKNFDKLEDIRVAYRVQDGVEELLGVCPIRHYPCHFGPTTLKAGGLSMVGVLPKYQKKGIGQFLLGCAEKYLSKEGFDVGLLFSGSPTFYQHQNWEVAVDHYFHTINAGSIPLDLDELGGLSLEARKLRESDFPAINELYENFNKDRVLTKVRDQAWWDKHHQRYTQESNPYYCFFNHSSLVAYVRVHPRVTGFTGAYLGKKTNDAYLTEYAIEPSIPVKEQRSIVEYLLAWLKDFAMQRGISLISTPLPDAYPLVGLMASLGAKDKTALLSSRMVLIVNVKSFISKLKLFQENVVIPAIPKENIDQLGYFDVGLHILEKKAGIDEIIQYLSDGRTIKVKINPPELPKNIIYTSRKNLGVMTLGNFLPADLVESEMWDCPIEYGLLFELFFPKLRSIVYHGDGF